jgi:hypothetical protein
VKEMSKLVGAGLGLRLRLTNTPDDLSGEMIFPQAIFSLIGCSGDEIGDILIKDPFPIFICKTEEALWSAFYPQKRCLNNSKT